MNLVDELRSLKPTTSRNLYDIVSYLRNALLFKNIPTFSYSHASRLDSKAITELEAYYKHTFTIKCSDYYIDEKGIRPTGDLTVIDNRIIVLSDINTRTEGFNVVTGEWMTKDLTFMFVGTPPTADELAFLERIVKESLARAKGDDKMFIQLFTNGPNGLNLSVVPLPKVKYQVQNYSPETNKWREILDRDLVARENKGRLTILQGPPGCGKTMFLRSFMSDSDPNKLNFIYAPMGVGVQITNPEFIQILLNQRETYPSRKTVLVLEDADLFIEDRKGQSATAVSEFLNTTDGMIGAALNLHILATTNISKQNFDSAVTRPGRLHSILYFDKLPAEQVASIWKRESGEDMPEPASMTLAEVYAKLAEHDNGVKKPKMESTGQYA